MAYFAKLNKNNIILAIHIVNSDLMIIDGVESEQAGVDFLTELYGHAIWKQTSYDASIRKNYAGVGFSYDVKRDAFIPQKPFASFILDENTCLWNAPTPMPTDGAMYSWDEEAGNWDAIA